MSKGLGLIVQVYVTIRLVGVERVSAWGSRAARHEIADRVKEELHVELSKRFEMHFQGL